MLSCKEVTELVSQSFDAEISARARLGIRFHLLLCRACQRYKQQIQILHQALRRLAGLAEDDTSREGETLSPESREKIKRALRHEKDKM